MKPLPLKSKPLGPDPGYWFLDAGCWMFLDFTISAFLIIQYQVSSIEYRFRKRNLLTYISSAG